MAQTNAPRAILPVCRSRVVSGHDVARSVRATGPPSMRSKATVALLVRSAVARDGTCEEALEVLAPHHAPATETEAAEAALPEPLPHRSHRCPALLGHFRDEHEVFGLVLHKQQLP